MGCSLSELDARFTPQEVAHWEVYEAVEPFGSTLLDAHCALLRHSQSTGEASPEKFRLHYQAPRRQSAEDMAAVLSRIT